MDINDFRRNSFVTHTTGLIERTKKMEAEYICLSCGKTYADGDTYFCTNCGEHICPKCGGECQTIKKYDEAMLINARES